MLDWFTPDTHHITAGAYAVVGAAAMAAGVTRTVSCAVMVFEVCGSETRTPGLRQPLLVRKDSVCVLVRDSSPASSITFPVPSSPRRRLGGGASTRCHETGRR